MYWLLDYEEQEQVRQKIIELQTDLSFNKTRNQEDQQFPFVGRKDRETARTMIEKLTNNDSEIVCDPFSGSGIFSYAALDVGRKVLMNEWEPYAFHMSTAPLRVITSVSDLSQMIDLFKSKIYSRMFEVYKTKCVECGQELMFDGLFFDRVPEEYYTPTRHNRMGNNGENIIFRGMYKCSCGQKQKKFDVFDQDVLASVNRISVDFPNPQLIENSRINFTYPEFSTYAKLFSHRQQVAIMLLYKEILTMPESIKDFFLDTFLSILHLGKYIDYHSKSQDNHCPEYMLKETNLYHRLLEALRKRQKYISSQNFEIKDINISCQDFRDFLKDISDNSVALVLTDPPYGDSAQYFEHAQRYHPFMDYLLSSDVKRLAKEVVISNAPSRPDKHGKAQFMDDIEQLFISSNRVLSGHGFFVMYFRPQQSDWISDLNKLKHLGRKHGLEPLITIPISNNDPSMRVLASAAWAFSKDICFVFLKLKEDERRWYIDDVDIDELVYLSCLSASDNKGTPFLIERFYQELKPKLASENLMKICHSKYQEHIEKTILRFCIKDLAQYKLTGYSPYNYMHREMNAEIRLREFAPIVIEELAANNSGFTFEDYVIHLASYMDNGSRTIIQKLHTANRLIPELMLQYAFEDKKSGKFYIKPREINQDDKGRISLYNMDPSDFERLIADYFVRRGFIKARVIGRSCDRGVDILATNSDGELELIQCKRYRKNNNIGSAPIQRIDSYMRSRSAKKAWVVTTSDFTREGIDEARITGVVLLNGNNLIRSLDVYYPSKYTL